MEKWLGPLIIMMGEIFIIYLWALKCLGILIFLIICYGIELFLYYFF